tara:strand:+ start:458 stop:829 length:372 start_codon:yes stop_codon:yes gene_type:complete
MKKDLIEKTTALNEALCVDCNKVPVRKDDKNLWRYRAGPVCNDCSQKRSDRSYEKYHKSRKKDLIGKITALNESLGVDLTALWLSHGKVNEKCFTHSYIKDIQYALGDIAALAESLDDQFKSA